MEWIVERDYESMSRLAATLVAEKIEERPHLVLGLATGSTPLGLYKCWREMVLQGRLSFAGVRTFNLDEYIGLPREHAQSYWTFMQENLFRHIDIQPEHVHLPDPNGGDPVLQGRRYEELIQAAGGIDVQILGIGRNGHIGFNEPGTDLGSTTHVVKLSESTRQANARFFESMEEVPTHALTMGMKSIMNARQVILLASGEEKSEAVYRAMFGEVTADHPASILQLHPNCLFLLDEQAASRLPKVAEKKTGGIIR
jgi:glucosamine-6-phosphate deaminase